MNQNYFRIRACYTNRSSTDPTLHENIYIINYLDDSLIKLINNEDLSEKVLRINNGELTNKSISKINILHTQKKKDMLDKTV